MKSRMVKKCRLEGTGHYKKLHGGITFPLLSLYRPRIVKKCYRETRHCKRVHGGIEYSRGRKLEMKCGSLYIPKDNKLKPQGEDSHFVFTAKEKQTIGVADGVGGWAAKGVDSGEYARGLMYNSLIAIAQEPKGGVDPTRVLNEAFLKTEAQGSSTACIVTLKDCYLHSVNVGDSGFMIFRNNRFLYQSPVQQHGFNCPYQLGNGENSDRPCSAKETKVAVVPGDIIVLGTDGVWDNVYPAEIEELLKRESKESMNSGQLAWSITELALYNSLDKYYYSPFARTAMLAGKTHMGGKVDDITVIVGHIVSSN